MFWCEARRDARDPQALHQHAHLELDTLNPAGNPPSPTLFMQPKPMRLMAPRLRAVSGGEKRGPSGALSTPSGTVTTTALARKQCVSVCTSTPAQSEGAAAGGGSVRMNWPWSGLNRVATGHQHDSGSGEIRQRAKCNTTALVSAQIGTTRSACRAHLWRSAAPPAPGCRRRRAARGRALPPTARCSLQRVTPRGGEWRLAMKQSQCAGRCKQVHTGPAKAQQFTAGANVQTQKRRS